MRIISIVLFLSTGALFAQTRLVDFQKLEADSGGLPVVQATEEVPLTKPTSFGFDTRTTLAKVSLIPIGNADGGMTISVDSNAKQSGFGELKWAPERKNWTHGPLRIRYWMVPRQENKRGGTFGIKFHQKKGDDKERAFLGTVFSKAAMIEIAGLETAAQPYVTDNKYEFDWLLNFDMRTASLSLNGQQWIKDAPLPEHWLTNRLFAFVFAGQSAGGGVEAQWDFGGLLIEEISGNDSPP